MVVYKLNTQMNYIATRHIGHHTNHGDKEKMMEHIRFYKQQKLMSESMMLLLYKIFILSTHS